MIACNNPREPQNMLDYFNRVYWTKKIGRSSNTRRLYVNTITLYGRWLGRVATLDDLNDDTCAAFLVHRHDDVSPHSAARDRCNLSAIANYAARKRHIPEFLTLPEIRVTMPTPVAIRPEQFAELMRAAAATVGRIGDVPASAWWSAFLMLVLVTGERTEAALSIRKEWVGSDGWLRIPASVRKGKRKSMEYELPQGVLSLLAPLMAAPGEMLFARPFCVGTFYHRYGKLLTAAGLPTGRRWKPQALRRTFASYLKLAGGDATDALNHDSPKTTKDSYLDPTVTDKPQPAGLILRFFGLKWPVSIIP